MRRLALLLLIALGCPAPTRYAVVRPGLGCDRATRVSYRTLTAMGYTVTSLVPATAATRGSLIATKPGGDGGTTTVRVIVSCDANGAVIQPVEEALAPTYDFSRGFGYSFTTLVQMPDTEKPQAAMGLQVVVDALTPQDAVLDLGTVATNGGAILVRVTVRNETDRAVAIDPARIELVPADGASAVPLAGGALTAALAPGAVGERVRSELLPARRIPAHTTVTGFLVYPPATYREARIAIEDVETEEAEGFVTPVE